jgi:hypothetical protein
MASHYLSAAFGGGWKRGFVLLAIVWILSSFLDNIAGALIGGAMAHQLFRAKVHVGLHRRDCRCVQCRWRLERAWPFRERHKATSSASSMSFPQRWITARDVPPNLNLG